MQVISDQREKLQIVEFLPQLTRRLHELIRDTLQFRMRRKVWRRVFQKSDVVGYDTFWGQLRTFAAHLEPPEVALTLSADEINHLTETALALSQELTNLDREFDKEWNRWKQDIERQLEAVNALLRIPDLFSGQQERRQVEISLNDITLFLGQTPRAIIDAGLDAQAQQWDGLLTRFSEIQGQLSFDAIAENYGLSAETVNVIQELVAGKTLTLDRVSSQTLDELSRFARFRSLVRLSFAPQPNRS